MFLLKLWLFLNIGMNVIVLSLVDYKEINENWIIYLGVLIKKSLDG